MQCLMRPPSCAPGCLTLLQWISERGFNELPLSLSA
jgi:hypothetical protein